LLCDPVSPILLSASASPGGLLVRLEPPQPLSASAAPAGLLAHLEPLERSASAELAWLPLELSASAARAWLLQVALLETLEPQPLEPLEPLELRLKGLQLPLA
jgi:hypothetical protein